MSRVLRPSWGHEIRRYLWQFSLGQAFVDWLKYSRYYVFSYGRYFWKHLVSLSCLAYDVWWIFEFGDSSLMISDSSFCRASDIHIRAYYPFSLRFLVVVGRYPYWRIFLSPWWDCVRAAIHKWMNIVGCLPHNFDIGYHIGAYSPLLDEIVHKWMIIVSYLPHDFDIRSYTGAYFPIFFEYPWDWDNGHLGFIWSTSLELLKIGSIRTFLHGFVEIEMDHIRFHSRSVDGFFSQMLMR